MPSPLNKKLTPDEITQQACKQLDAGLLFRQKRFQEIMKNEDIISGVLDPVLPGRFNVPIDTTMANGFLETLLSKVDNPPSIKFKAQQISKTFSAQKISAMFERDTAADREALDMKDLMSKRMCAIAGVAYYKVFSDSVDGYQFHLELADYYDMVCEPNGGWDLDKHLFKYQMNIFKTKADLLANEAYDLKQVKKLIDAYTEKEKRFDVQSSYNNKVDRMQRLGYSQGVSSYVGTDLYNLTEGVMTDSDGYQWYILFDAKTKIWLRCEPLKDVFGSGLSPWIMWSFSPDPFNYLPKGPLDMVRPALKAIKIAYNANLDNLQKRNFEMKIVDGQIFPDISELKYRPDGVVVANLQAEGKTIQNGLKLLETADTTGNSLAIINFTRGLIGSETGISDAAKGVSDQDKVGINAMDLEQIADRFTLKNRFYSHAHLGIGKRYDWGLYEHLTGKEMVEIIGPNGVRWEEITKEDTDPDYTIVVKAGNSEELIEARAKEEKNRAIENMIKSGAIEVVNKKVLAEEIVKMGWDEATSKQLLDKDGEGTLYERVKAEQAITDIISGKKPKLYKSATIYFVKYIVDYANENYDDDDPSAHAMYLKLMKYAENVMRYAEQNTITRSFLEQAKLQGQAKEMQLTGNVQPNGETNQPAIIPSQGATATI